MNSLTTWVTVEEEHEARKAAAMMHAVTTVAIETATLAEARLVAAAIGSEEHVLALADLIRSRREVFSLCARYIEARRALARFADAQSLPNREAA